MLTSDPSVHKDTSVSRAGDDERGRTLFGRLLGYAILFAFIAVVAAAVVFSVKISEGVSRNLGSPSVLVRLQIVNASGVTGMGARIASQISGFADSDIEIKVVDTSDFNSMKVSRTFVIARTDDGKEAKLLATKLGFDPSTIVTKILEHDTRLVAATLVVGEDYGVISLKKKNL